MQEGQDPDLLTFPCEPLKCDLQFSVSDSVIAECNGDDPKPALLYARVWSLCVLPLIYQILGRPSAWISYASIFNSSLGYNFRPFNTDDKENLFSTFDMHCTAKIPYPYERILWPVQQIKDDKEADIRRRINKNLRAYSAKITSVLTERSRASRILFASNKAQTLYRQLISS